MQQPTDPSGEPGPTQVGDAPFPSIPGYRFRKRLGQGGMATVYLATQESLDRPVSIKVMAREGLQDETSKQRFENEARTIAKLSHAGIVGIHEVGRTADGHMYYVMPYLPNGDLAHRDLRNDEPQIKEILRALLSALGYAHSHGIVHRDVKEENVLFDAHNRPLLTDFGIARSKADTSRLTQAGLSVGSSGFMAPEQARGEEVDGRADLYSVGVLTFALLTGRLPFRATDPLAMAIMHAQDPIPRLPEEKRHWQGFIDRAMAKAPSQRYANAEQMLKALEGIDRQGDSGWFARTKRSLGEAMANKGGRKRFAVLALAGVLLLAAVLFAARTWFAEPDSIVASTAPPPSSSLSQNTVTANNPPPSNVPESSASTPASDVAPSEEEAPAETQSTTSPETSPTQTSAKPPAKPATAQPAPARHQPVKKIKGWFSRLFHHH